MDSRAAEIDRAGVVGAGRVGTALASALRAGGLGVDGPQGRGRPAPADVIVLCVPDAEIAAAAADARGAAPLVGHTSGATPLSALRGSGAEAFGLHPLQTVPEGATGDALAGAPCAIAGASPRALAAARRIAETAGMVPFEIDDSRRPAYHAAASIASNFLVTLEHAAERVAGGAGLSPAEARVLLAPLVRRTAENWAATGPERALTGPIARGDDETVARQREAVALAAPDLLPLWDAMAAATGALARKGAPA